MSDQLQTRFPRQPRRGMLLGFSKARVIASISAVMLIVLALMLHRLDTTVFCVMVGSALIASASIAVQGRYIIEWAPLVVQWQARRVGKQRTYRARVGQRRPAGTLALPGNAANLRFVNVDDATYIHDPSAATLTAALRVEHSAMVLLDNEAQAERVANWGRVLSGLAGSESVHHMAIMEETIPDTGNGPMEWFKENWTGTDDWASQQYYYFLGTTRAQSSIHRTTVTISVKVGRRGLDDAILNIESLQENLEMGLRSAGLRIKHWLSEAEFASQIRGAYAPFTPPTGRQLQLAGPIAIDESWDQFRHDDGFSCVLVIAEFPAVPVGPQFLHSLIFADGARHTLTLIYKVQALEEALKQVRSDKMAIQSGFALKRKVGQIDELSDHTELAATEARELALLQGHAAVAVTALVTVSTATADDLKRAVAQVKRNVGQCACEARVIHSMQTAAFVASALPVGRDI